MKTRVSCWTWIMLLISYSKYIKHTWFCSGEKKKYILSFIYHKISKKMLLFIVVMLCVLRCVVSMAWANVSTFFNVCENSMLSHLEWKKSCVIRMRINRYVCKISLGCFSRLAAPASAVVKWASQWELNEQQWR